MNSLPHCSQVFLLPTLTVCYCLIFANCMGQTSRNEVTIAGLESVDTERYGTVSVNKDGYVTGFAEKTGSTGPINGGVYWLNKHWLQNKFLNQECASFEQQILPKLASDGLLKLCALGNVPFIDIGVPETYRKASEFIKTNLIFFQEDL